MRVFFAVLPPADVVDDLAARIAAYADRDDAEGWRWSAPGHLHLTLLFVPDLAEGEGESAMVARVEQWAERQRPIRMTIAGAGAFPDPAAAKVLWVGVAEPNASRALEDWASSLRLPAGSDGDDRPFRPHVTVARSRQRRVADGLVRDLDSYRSRDFAVDDIALVSSRLGRGPNGSPLYDIRHRFRLGREASAPVSSD